MAWRYYPRSGGEEFDEAKLIGRAGRNSLARPLTWAQAARLSGHRIRLRRTGMLPPALINPAMGAAAMGAPVSAVSPPMMRPMTSPASRTTVVCSDRKGGSGGPGSSGAGEVTDGRC